MTRKRWANLTYSYLSSIEISYAQKIRKEEFSWANIETKLGVNQDIDPHVRSGQKIPLCQFSELAKFTLFVMYT